MVFEKCNVVSHSFRTMSPWNDALMKAFLESIEGDEVLSKELDRDKIKPISMSFFNIMIHLVESFSEDEKFTSTIKELNSEDYGVLYFRYFDNFFDTFVTTLQSFSGGSWTKEASLGWKDFKEFLLAKKDSNVELFV